MKRHAFHVILALLAAPLIVSVTPELAAGQDAPAADRDWTAPRAVDGNRICRGIGISATIRTGRLFEVGLRQASRHMLRQLSAVGCRVW